jgi:hypothetical protein
MNEFTSRDKHKLLARLQESLDATKLYHKAFQIFIDKIKTRGQEYLIYIDGADTTTARLRVLDRVFIKLSCRLVRRASGTLYCQMVVFMENPDEPVFMNVFELTEHGFIKSDGEISTDIEDFFIFLHLALEDNFREYHYPGV